MRKREKFVILAMTAFFKALGAEEALRNAGRKEQKCHALP
jgi:hypothetical protein